MIALQISTLSIIFFCSYTIRALFSSSSVDQLDLLEDLGYVEAGYCREGRLPREVPSWFAGRYVNPEHIYEKPPLEFSPSYQLELNSQSSLPTLLRDRTFVFH